MCVSASASQSQSRHVAIRRVWKLRCAHTPGVQLEIAHQVLCVYAYDLDLGNTPPPLDQMVLTMGPKVNISVSAEGLVKGPEQAHHHLDLVQG